MPMARAATGKLPQAANQFRSSRSETGVKRRRIAAAIRIHADRFYAVRRRWSMNATFRSLGWRRPVMKVESMDLQQSEDWSQVNTLRHNPTPNPRA